MLRDENGQEIAVGGPVGGPVVATVMSIQEQEGHDGSTTGVVLGWSDPRREYWVWSVGPTGELHDGVHRYDLTDALNLYNERIMARLYRHYNRIAPTWTYERRNTQ